MSNQDSETGGGKSKSTVEVKLDTGDDNLNKTGSEKKITKHLADT